MGLQPLLGLLILVTDRGVWNPRLTEQLEARIRLRRVDFFEGRRRALPVLVRPTVAGNRASIGSDLRPTCMPLLRDFALTGVTSRLTSTMKKLVSGGMISLPGTRNCAVVLSRIYLMSGSILASQPAS